MNVSWNAFFIFTAVGLVVYYAIVFFVFYKKKPALAASGNSSKSTGLGSKKSSNATKPAENKPTHAMAATATNFIDTKDIREEDYILPAQSSTDFFPEYDPAFDDTDAEALLQPETTTAVQSTMAVQPTTDNTALPAGLQAAVSTDVNTQVSPAAAETERFTADVPWETFVATSHNSKHLVGDPQSNNTGINELQEPNGSAPDNWYDQSNGKHQSDLQAATSINEMVLAMPEREPQQVSSLMHLVSSKKSFH